MLENVYIYGAIGTILVEVHALYKLRYKKFSQFPDHYKSLMYYIISFVVMPIVGMFFVFMHVKSGPAVGLSIGVALHIGVASPLLLERLFNASPDIRE